jgi:hypothetical protein
MKERYKTHYVRIVRKQRKCFVIPGTVIVSPGDKVVFKSINEGEINIFFPRGDYFNPEKRVVDLTEENDFNEVISIPENASSGVYSYSIFCEKSDDFAEGNTPPTMIVEQR